MSGIPKETKAVNFVLLYYIFIYIIQINDKTVMLGRLSYEISRDSEESFRTSDDDDYDDDDDDDVVAGVLMIALQHQLLATLERIKADLNRGSYPDYSYRKMKVYA